MSDCLDNIVIRVREPFSVRRDIETLLVFKIMTLKSLVGYSEFEHEFSIVFDYIDCLFDLGFINHKNYVLLKNILFQIEKEN